MSVPVSIDAIRQHDSAAGSSSNSKIFTPVNTWQNVDAQEVSDTRYPHFRASLSSGCKHAIQLADNPQPKAYREPAGKGFANSAASSALEDLTSGSVVPG